MNDIGIKYARQHFREVIDEVAEGGSMTLVRRGVPVARLTGVDASREALPSLASFRRSISVDGSPLSEQVGAARGEERY